jgi:hypothetical protein
LALEKAEQDIKIRYSSLTFELGRINGTAPFQSLVQHFENYGKDVFVTNFFNAFIAYQTTPTDLWLNSTDKMYLGYTMVEQHLLNILTQAISGEGWPAIGNYGWEAFFNNAANPSWGIEYSNMLVFWQEVAANVTSFPRPAGLPSGVTIEGVDGVVTGGDLVAATLFDTMKFTYELSETTTTVPVGPDNYTVTTAQVTTKYDLGAVKLMITREDAAKLAQIRAAVPEINASNSFNIPAQDVTLGSVNIGGTNYVFVVHIPDFCFYRDEAARLRIDAAAMEGQADGMGISVVSSTNMYSVGYSITFPNPVTGQNVEYPIMIGGKEVFDTSFVGKSTYNLTNDDGSVDTYPINVAMVAPGHGYVKHVFKAYFKVEAKMMEHFLVYMAKNVSPIIAGLMNATSPTGIKMSVDDATYLTFVQMPKWSGHPIVQDPAFSAVSAVKATGTDDDGDDGEPANTQGILDQIPGFEFLAVLVVFPVMLAYKRRK